MVHFCLGVGQRPEREARGAPNPDALCLEEGGDYEMKFDKLLKHDVITGIVLGALIGLYFPLEAYKPLLVILAVVMGLKVTATK